MVLPPTVLPMTALTAVTAAAAAATARARAALWIGSQRPALTSLWCVCHLRSVRAPLPCLTVCFAPRACACVPACRAAVRVCARAQPQQQQPAPTSHPRAAAAQRRAARVRAHVGVVVQGMWHSSCRSDDSDGSSGSGGDAASVSEPLQFYAAALTPAGAAAGAANEAAAASSAASTAPSDGEGTDADSASGALLPLSPARGLRVLMLRDMRAARRQRQVRDERFHHKAAEALWRLGRQQTREDYFAWLRAQRAVGRHRARRVRAVRVLSLVEERRRVAEAREHARAIARSRAPWRQPIGGRAFEANVFTDPAARPAMAAVDGAVAAVMRAAGQHVPPPPPPGLAETASPPLPPHAPHLVSAVTPAPAGALAALHSRGPAPGRRLPHDAALDARALLAADALAEADGLWGCAGALPAAGDEAERASPAATDEGQAAAGAAATAAAATAATAAAAATAAQASSLVRNAALADDGLPDPLGVYATAHIRAGAEPAGWRVTQRRELRQVEDRRQRARERAAAALQREGYVHGVAAQRQRMPVPTGQMVRGQAGRAAAGAGSLALHTDLRIDWGLMDRLCAPEGAGAEEAGASGAAGTAGAAQATKSATAATATEAARAAGAAQAAGTAPSAVPAVPPAAPAHAAPTPAARTAATAEAGETEVLAAHPPQFSPGTPSVPPASPPRALPRSSLARHYRARTLAALALPAQPPAKQAPPPHPAGAQEPRGADPEFEAAVAEVRLARWQRRAQRDRDTAAQTEERLMWEMRSLSEARGKVWSAEKVLQQA